MADSTTLGSYKPCSPIAVPVQREHGGMGQEVTNSIQILVHQSPGHQAAENIKYGSDAISVLNQEASFLLPLPPALPFKPGHSTCDTRHLACLLNV